MDWKPIIDQIVLQAVSYGAPVVGAIIVGLLSVGIRRFNSWIRTKELGESMKTAVLQVSEATISAVADLEATMRPYMADGKLSKDEQRQIKEAALNRIKRHAPKALDVLTQAGLRDLDTWIGGKIEDAVMKLPESTGTKGTEGTEK